MNIQLTPIVKNLLIINVLVFVSLMILQESQPALAEINQDYFTLNKSNLLGFRNVVNDGTAEYFVKYGKGGQVMGAAKANNFNPLQLLTHFFNHGSFSHIFWNMFALVMFGPAIERVMGERRFLQFYLFCGLLAGIFVAFLDPTPNPVVGASGALFGMMLAFAMYYPNAQLLLFFVVPMKAITLTWLLGIGSAVLFLLDWAGSDLGSMGNISHFGHLSGMIAALVFFYVRPHVSFLR